MSTKNYLYVGIDVSLKSLMTCIQDISGENIFKPKSFSNDPDGVNKLLDTILCFANSLDITNILIGIEATSVYGTHLLYTIADSSVLNNFTVQLYCFEPKIIKNFSINNVNYSMIKNIFIKPFDYEILCSSIDKLCKISSKKNNENIIDEVLHEFCFNFSSLFYQYLIQCIEKEINSNIPLKQLYNEVAKNSNIGSNKIKWGVEKLISAMVRYTPEEKIKDFFPYTNRPSTKTFILTIAEIVKKKGQE